MECMYVFAWLCRYVGSGDAGQGWAFVWGSLLVRVGGKLVSIGYVREDEGKYIQSTMQRRESVKYVLGEFRSFPCEEIVKV